jgi:putative membrane protein
MLLHKKTGLKLLAYYLEYKREDILKGALAGAIGGLAGSGLMTLGQTLLAGKKNGRHPSPQSIRDQSEKEPAEKVVAAISEKTMHSTPSPTTEKIGGALVHLAFGSGVGAAYGAISEVTPKTGRWIGAPFGTALWAAADLGAMPALGLSKPPTRVPVSRHAQMLGMHLAYAFATDAVRRYVRDILD